LNSITEDVNISDIYCDKAYEKKRSTLPLLRENSRLSMWSILKDSIGKEFSKIKVPGKLFLII
jgi:hypothetical protein